MFQLINYSFNLISYIMLFELCIMVSIVYVAMHRLDKPAYIFFSLYCVLSLVYSAAYLLQTMAVPLEIKIFWANIKVTSICFTPLVWIWLTFMVTNRKFPSLKINIPLISIAVINTLILWNDSKLHVFRESVTLVQLSDSISIMKPTFGIWFMTVYLWSLYLPCVISIMLYLVAMLNTGRSGKFQYGLMIGAICIALVGGMPQIVNKTPVDSYAISIAFSSVMFFILVHRYHIFDVVPMAKNAVLDMVESGVLIYNSEGKQAEMNAYAKSKFPQITPRTDLTETCAYFGIGFDSIRHCKSLSIVKEFPETGCIYTVKLITISEAPSSVDGYIIFINDITEQSKLAEIKKAKDIAEYKNSIIRDIHDSIGGSVSVISILAEQGLEKAGNAADYLEKIKEISGYTGREVRFMMNTYDKKEFTLEELLSDVRYIGNILVVDSGIGFVHHSDADESLLDAGINFSIFVNIVYFYKECIVNALKHSRASKIESRIHADSDNILIRINDDGIGFGKDIKKGRGLKNITSRINSINGEVAIRNNNGTEIECRIPMKDNYGKQ